MESHWQSILYIIRKSDLLPNQVSMLSRISERKQIYMRSESTKPWKKVIKKQFLILYIEIQQTTNSIEYYFKKWMICLKDDCCVKQMMIAIRIRKSTMHSWSHHDQMKIVGSSMMIFESSLSFVKWFIKKSWMKYRSTLRTLSKESSKFPSFATSWDGRMMNENFPRRVSNTKILGSQIFLKTDIRNFGSQIA